MPGIHKKVKFGRIETMGLRGIQHSIISVKEAVSWLACSSLYVRLILELFIIARNIIIELGCAIFCFSRVMIMYNGIASPLDLIMHCSKRSRV